MSVTFIGREVAGRLVPDVAKARGVGSNLTALLRPARPRPAPGPAPVSPRSTR